MKKVESPHMVQLPGENFGLFISQEHAIFLKNIMRHYRSPYGKDLNGFPLELRDLLEKVVKGEWKE